VTQTTKGASETVSAIGADAQRVGSITLPELEQLLSDLSVLSASIRHLSEQTERSPSGLVFGHSTTRPGPGEDDIVDQKP
jgi:phospholipid/cholesterol/gamma-HCH transport system substrate-binding protein